MLQDIAQVSLAVGRHLFPKRSWDDLDIAAGSLLSRKSPVERLGFITRLLQDLSGAVEQIALAPLVAPVNDTRIAAPPDRARRVGTAALLRAVRSGHAGRWMEDTVTALSPDTPENRAVCAFLGRLRRDSQAIRGMAEAASEPEIAHTAQHCAGQLSGLGGRLEGEGLGSPSAAAWSAPPTHRMLAHPVYARVADWIRRYRQSFSFDWGHPLFGLPSRETWRLYETWGLFQTLQAMITLGYEPADMAADASALFGVKEDRLFFRLMKGQESRVLLRGPQGRTVVLFYNRTYAARRQSLSRTMQPDIALEDGEGQTWILDPKFKSYDLPGAEGDDVDQMHAYRDAIVDGNGHKPVQRAWCLYTGSAAGTARPLIAYGPSDRSVVGALCLRPGDAESFARLCQLLADWGL
jgi:hypothetical protein